MSKILVNIEGFETQKVHEKTIKTRKNEENES